MSTVSQNTGKSKDTFSVCTHLTPVRTVPLSVTYLPGSGDEVISQQHGNLYIKDEIATGGEGTAFHTNNGLVCKIYKEDMLTEARLKKLELMVSKPITHPGIFWPLFIVFNRKREFIGYTMKQAKGVELEKAVLFQDTLRKKFPNWKKESLVQLSLTILERIIHLHERNVFIGDINARNILLNNEYDVSFVDTDSYQIEGYPCPVGTPHFTAPEIQLRDCRTFLRTFNHEYFAIATLLFIILLNGKPPYAIKGGTTPTENIMRMDFPYPLIERTNNKVPDGGWIYLWNHFPFEIKDAFYDVFKNNKRKSPKEWYQILTKYRDDLVSGRASNELFPRSFLRSNRKIHCSLCNTIFYEDDAYVRRLRHNKILYCCPKCAQIVKKGKTIFIGTPTNSKKQGRTLLNLRLGNNLLDQFFDNP